jgi:DNA-binding PadR family transcriptional regulator
MAGFGRHSEPALFVLVSLADGPKHGYSMMDDIEGITRNRLCPVTLYGAIARLEKRGFIEALESSDRRKPYQLTHAGRAALGEQLAGLKALVGAGLARIATA